MGVDGQCHAPAALPSGKTRYPLCRRVGGPEGWSGRLQKISPPPGLESRTAQPIASRYTDTALLAHTRFQSRIENWGLICGALAWNVLRVTLLAPRILRCLLGFWIISGPVRVHITD